MDDARLQAIRERLGKATKGPWEAGTMTHTGGLVETWIVIPGAAGFFLDGTDEDGATWTVNGYSTAQGPNDAAFIAHSWQDVADLLAEIASLKAELTALRAVVEAAKEIKADLLMRADTDPDGTKVVHCSMGRWAAFCDALATLTPEPTKEPDHG